MPDFFILLFQQVTKAHISTISFLMILRHHQPWW